MIPSKFRQDRGSVIEISLSRTGVSTSLRCLLTFLEVNERYGDFSSTDEPLSIVSMDNSENRPNEESERCHTKRDKIVS